jgi:hypothetical protein
MGRFSLFILKKIILCSLVVSQASAREIEGIKIPETLNCHGKELPLQGVGIRKATIFGIKVYALSYYGENNFKKINDPLLESRPICINVNYLRDFDNEDVDKAWEYQFKESSSFPYDKLKDHIKEIKSFFGDIKGERLQTFHLNDEGTIFFENNNSKGEIKGREFQKNFLSLFFGEKPPTKELRNELLNLKD